MRSIETGDTYYGICTDLSVSGLSIRTSFVPRCDEQLEVTVLAPATGQKRPQPLSALTRVRRCHELQAGVLYELGLEILEIKK